MVIVPLGKLSFAFFGGKVRFLKGERGKPIYWCMLFRTNSLLSFLIFFPFLSVFVLIFFLLFLLCFSFYVMKNPLFFDPGYRAQQGPLYSAFPSLSCGLSFGPSLQSEAGLRMMMGFIFLWPTFVFFLCCLPCWLVIPAVMTQSCWAPFWAGHFIPFLSGLS